MEALFYKAISRPGFFYLFIPPSLWEDPPLCLGMAFPPVERGESSGEGEPFLFEGMTKKVHT